ncbi:nucleoside recognition domain-containing protein [Maledivibacter halophilus]|uniref:Nucleoside recognition n=1 Tax=Maledivibacter halophilus TaxID=36842 RepID=A0A1T5MT51_9FIRM|nr:nucleoside recognition domain-containing protein [Maledivibacter halophilus]SKC91407.1 Nucleoside recognition [Maledivibacter halophilus]
MIDMTSVISEGLIGGLKSVFNIAIIVFPLMIAMEIAKDLKLLDKISDFCKPLTKWLGVSKESAFPLAIGLVIGLAYGAGIIIQNAKEGNLDKRSLILVSIFLVCCHAVIEDTLIFVAVGANGFLLLTMRLVTALILTIIISKKLPTTNE